MPATISVTRQFMSCRVSAESRTAQLHSPNSFSSQFSAKPMAQLQSQFIDFSPGFMCHRSLAAEISHFWERQSLSCLTGENKNILPGLLLSSQWQANQTEAALPKLLLHKVDSSGSTAKESSPCSNFQTSPCPRRTFQRWRFQSRVYLTFTLCAVSLCASRKL